MKKLKMKTKFYIKIVYQNFKNLQKNLILENQFKLTKELIFIKEKIRQIKKIML